MTRSLTVLLGLLLWTLPLVLAVGASIGLSFGIEPWQAMLGHPQIPAGLALALFTGTVSLLLALAMSILVIAAVHGSRIWRHMPLACGAALAIPHLAFAVGFGLLAMPSGLLARLLVGGAAPPDWITMQDPYGLSLITILSLKEMPFLAFMLWSALSQGDSAAIFEGHIHSARSLGHGLRSIWLRVLLPQLLRRIFWPIVIVWVYGVTVVDLALVAGPTQPPTAAVTVWTALNDADRAVNLSGMAGAWLLLVMLVLAGGLAALVWRTARPLLSHWLTTGPATASPRRSFGLGIAGVSAASYLLVFTVLMLVAFSQRWPYPDILPPGWSLSAWQRLDWLPLAESLALAAATSLASTGLLVLWFETMAAAWDRILVGLALIALGLPGLVIAAGQYQLFLTMGLTGTRAGLFLAHLTPVLAYAALVLRQPYRSFDPRMTAVARSLGATPLRRWRVVTLPLLRAPLLMALAVGFSVSLVQYVPSQLIAAGRITTLPMEAVTLSAGGNRPLTAASALLLAFPAFAGFALAGILGRPRWR